jgi:hypothetical protein
MSKQTSLDGMIKCANGHVWEVKVLNPKRITVLCPVCGTRTAIKDGVYSVTGTKK